MTDTISIPAAEPKTPTPRQVLRGRILRHKGVMVGGAVVVFIALVALLAPVLAPHDPYAQSLIRRLQPPVWMEGGSWTHPLGTDHLGRDYLSRLMYGAQISLVIGVCTALISGVLGTTLGVLAGYFGGRIDSLITFLVTVKLSIPTILLALAVVQLIGGSLTVVILVLGFLLWHQFALVARSVTMQIRDMDYITAAKTIGCSPTRILLTEVMPNLMNQIIVVLTLTIASAIVVEAALSFLGVGVKPPLPSWGIMIAEGRSHIFFRPWLVMIPGVALFALVLSINLLGDGLRDVTSPQGRN
ncbi:ABC transporter permease [Roseinatronobacter sp. NSM]|uniref:ABC transporter permease n=1 Tax=Roseinatronobacter sp. NSM TaxID=3457785 RepID=UPI004035D595